jgi:hypothetical protein
MPRGISGKERVVTSVPDDVLKKMQRLAAVTFDNGYHPNEVEFAAVKLQALLAEHQLSLTDIHTGEIKESVSEDKMYNVDERGYKHSWRRSVIQYADYICLAFDCKRIHCKSGALAFVGLDSDVKVARYFFETTWPKIKKAGDKEGRKQGLRHAKLIAFYDQFLMGAGFAIWKRLKPPDHVQHNNQLQTAALVPIKQRMVDEFMEEHHPDVKTDKYQVRAKEGFGEGYLHGTLMPLTRGVEGGSRSAKALGVG